MPASTSPPRAGRARTGRARARRHGLAVAIPDGHAGFVQPRSGLAAKHGITIVNAPGLVDSGYRGELKVIAAQHRPRRGVRRRARDADRATRRPRRADTGPSRWKSCREASAATRASAARPTDAAEPRIRVSAVLRWEGRVLLCRHEKSGRGEYWLLPGGGVNSGESLIEALRRELRGGGRDRGRSPFEGPVAIVDSIAPKRGFIGKHVVHIIFAADSPDARSSA